MDDIKVIHMISQGIQHNWEVYQDGFLLGYVHCNGDGKDFGGSLGSGFDTDKLWDQVQGLCFDDLADLYLIDRMETLGY